MTIYFYTKNKKYYVSPIPIHTNGTKQLAVFDDYEIEDIEYTTIPKSVISHILNFCTVIPPRKSKYLIINKKNKKITTFEQFNVLKNYKIEEDDVVFEIYYINHAIKVYYMKYGEVIDLKRYYHICMCGNIHTDDIQVWTGCTETVCSDCNPFDSLLCSNCDVFEDMENIEDVEKDTEEMYKLEMIDIEQLENSDD